MIELIVFIVQFLSILLRTINIKQIQKGNILGASYSAGILGAMFCGAAYLSYVKFSFIMMIIFFTAGFLGNYISLKYLIKKDNEYDPK